MNEERGTLGVHRGCHHSSFLIHHSLWLHHWPLTAGHMDEQLSCRTEEPWHTICLAIQCPRSEQGLELLVIVSALGIWCFDNWTDSVQWAVRSLRPVVEALIVSFRDRADSFRMGLESM